MNILYNTYRIALTFNLTQFTIVHNLSISYIIASHSFERQHKMQVMNPLASELNKGIQNTAPTVFALLSDLGRRIYLPKGILSQSTEATVQAYHINATRAVATVDSQLMHLNVSHIRVPTLPPESVYGYPPILGNSELRKLWKTHICTENPLLNEAQIGLPIVTSGLTHCFSLLSDLFVNPGDTLVLPDKCWGNYRLTFETKAGAVIQNYPFFNTDMCFNINGFRKSLYATDSDKVLILLNFPHNPTGYSLTLNEAHQIRDAIVSCADKGKNVLVMVDDAYSGFWYDTNVMHESLFGVLVGCHPNVVPVKVDGTTKEEYAWGLRIGFLTFGFPESAMQPIEEKLSGLIRVNTSGAAQLSQTLILEAMKTVGHIEQKQRNFEILKERALKVQQIANDSRFAKLWDVYPSHAGYFVCLSLRSVNAESVRQMLLDEHGIGTIALSETELRVAFSCIDLTDIEMVFNIIAQVVQSQKV